MLDFKFPDVGEGIHEGTIVKWRVKEGDEVKSDQVLVEIETDKAIVEIPAPRAGVIAKTFHQEKEIIKVGESLVIITDKGEHFEAPAEKSVPVPELANSELANSPLGAPTSTGATTTQPPDKVGATVPSPAPVAEKGPGVVGSIDSSNTEIAPVKVSARAETQSPAQNPTSAIKILPATRSLATKLGVDISQIKGSGPNNMITDGDILTAKNMSPATTLDSARVFSGPVTRVPYKGIRKAIGDHMVESHTHTVPVTHFDTIDVSKLVAKREAEKPQAEAKNIKLTFLAYITQAVAQTLKEFPAINAELDEATQEIITKNYYNIGIAVDTDDGLYVPTIKNADQKDLFAIAQEITDIAEKARTKKLTAQDMSDGTFTITNYGSIGGDFATPVINYPEAAILGIGKIKDAFVLDATTHQPIATKTISLSLTFDHRILDGATAARFINALAQKLQ